MTGKYRFLGEYECKLDTKGRLKLPSALVRQIGESGTLNFVIHRGSEKHLSLYPQVVWDKKTNELINRLNLYNTEHKQILRYWNRGATQLSADSTDRILIPRTLIEFAGLEKVVVLNSVLDEIEIWDKAMYQSYIIDNEPKEMAHLMQKHLGGSRDNSSSAISDNG